jgi:hypothetical protein
MATQNEPNERGNPGFRISDGPVVRRSSSDMGVPSEFDEVPRVYGPPLLFAIPRDPQTIFAYWNVDWSDIFSRGEPVDRHVYLRIRKSDGTDESEAVVEPMLGSYYAGVAQPGGIYQTELGYYDASGGWSAVANSEPVAMPQDSASESMELDLATVPFHLSFQRLIDLFRSSNGNALSAIMARLQRRAITRPGGDGLTPEEMEILRAMELSVSDLDMARESFEKDDQTLRKKAEAVLGFGATSPGQAFGDSSWGSSPA